MIPVAAVARPRQGIRVPATGVPALSAGTIVATAGDGQVTITQGAAPTGAITSRTLYRSTAAGQLGTAVPSFAGTYPFPDTGRTNATTYYYTLRVSDGSAVDDTDQVSATPQAAGSYAPPDLYSHGFENGSMGQFTNPWEAGITIEDDTTGILGGKVARIDYDIAYDGSLDRALSWVIRNTSGVAARLTYGDVLWSRQVFSAGPTSKEAPARKLYDLLPQDNGNESGGGMRLFVNIRGGGAGVTFGWTADWRDYDGNKGLLASEYTSHPFPGFGTRVVLEVGIFVNSAAGVANGGFDIYANGSLVASRRDLPWLTGFEGARPHHVLIGSQITAKNDVPGEEPPVTDVRRIGEVAFSTTRIGP